MKITSNSVYVENNNKKPISLWMIQYGIDKMRFLINNTNPINIIAN